MVTRGWGGVRWGGCGGGQIALLWMAVLEAGVKRVKMGADTWKVADLVVEVAQLVPALHLKEKRSAP